jgi:putative transposase
VLTATPRERRALVERSHPVLPVSRQCALLGVARSSVYYTPNTSESDENLAYMALIDQLYTEHPSRGVPRMTDCLQKLGWDVNHKRVARLMQVMSLQAAVPGPHTSVPHPEHMKYPYLLRNLAVEYPDQVWCADITYIPMARGFMYLVAVMDWHTRYVIAWDLSNTMEAAFCVDALTEALESGSPGIFNTDQGSQFTSEEFTGLLKANDVRISMDGRGRALDNVFIERLWRTVKYEHVYLHAHVEGRSLYRGLKEYFRFYNHERSHSSLGMRTPAECYHDR